MTETKLVLSLAVREKLMRGQSDEAVATLMEEQKINQQEAESYIGQYRAQLRERQLELEAQKMHHEQHKEELRDKYRLIRYIAWGVAALVFLALIGLLSKAI